MENRETNPAFLGLWIHNLQLFRADATVPAPAAKIVVYSRNAMFSKTLLECLFASVYTLNPVFVVDETTFHQHPEYQGVSPDVVVFSILDGSCWSGWDPRCRQAAADYVQLYGSTSLLVMLSGEAWDVDGLDDSVLLISTVAHVPRRKHVYIPMASLSFGERLIQSPLLLLANTDSGPSSLLEEPQSQLTHRKFCAYMYARCDRPQREYMFDLLSTMEPVDALGACQGSSRAPNEKRWTGRSSIWYNDDAVRLYSQYKFVIAFENGQRPGYVTEKLVNAFLAGSVPIYFGHSESVAQVFNPESFIDCGRFAMLRECAAFVIEVHRSPAKYTRMARAPVIANVSLFHELFSWHPDIPSSHLSDRIREFLLK
jgi:hypothetical protein